MSLGGLRTLHKWLSKPTVIWFHEIVNEENYRKRRWGWPQIAVVVFVVVALIGALVPTFNSVARKSNQAVTAGNCKQIIMALRLYAEEHGGTYPDTDSSEPPTSNDAFHVLFTERILDDERVFGAKLSPFVPNNIIGDAPDFPKALEPGENHWAMTKGVKESGNPLAPLVFENPVSPSWPPNWNADAIGKQVKGRTWRGGRIIVGFNDSSVRVIQLESAKGSDVLPAREADGKDVFTRAGDPMDMLDIRE